MLKTLVVKQKRNQLKLNSMAKKSKGKRKDLLKKDPKQKENLTYENKIKADKTVTGRTVAPPPEIIEELKNSIRALSEKEKEKSPKKIYSTSRPRTAFNMRKRHDQTN